MSLFRCLFFLIPFASSLFALDVKTCYVDDVLKHRDNRMLLGVILREEIEGQGKKDPADIALGLSAKVESIALKLLKRGFSTDAYAVPKLDADSAATYNRFILWEGDRNDTDPIPLTFFVYVWPSEQYALQHNSRSENSYYRTRIHSHPISCAFAVLEGTLIQKNFELDPSSPMPKTVRLLNVEAFKKGEGEVDDLKHPFIHQVYGKNDNLKPTFSLHAYGLSSGKQVVAKFVETLEEHTYQNSFSESNLVEKAVGAE